MLNRGNKKTLLPRSNFNNKKDDDYNSREKCSSNMNQNKVLTFLDNHFKKFQWKVILYSSLFWVITINYYETTYVKNAINQCMWNKWEKWDVDSNSHKVALFADPQIMDAHSYPGRPRPINYITRAIIDHYHSRNWKYVQYYLDPDTNFFLGDLFDGGRRWEDDYWIKEYERFHSIFPKKPNRKTVFSLPGNHDIGFGDTVVESSFERFSTFFGETSSRHDVGNHTFVLLDTISLSDTTNENISSVPKQFLTQYAKEVHPFPRILLTHVPLWRDPKEQQCGSERESPNLFPIMRGVQYQTVIDQSISQDVLSTIAPKYVFSGDDHDYCHIKHSYFSEGTSHIADEITVKSNAMNMGINKPAIQLLSLLNDGSSTDTIQTAICYMPNAFIPLLVYAVCAVINLFVVIYMVIKTRPKQQNLLPMPVGTDYDNEKSHHSSAMNTHTLANDTKRTAKYSCAILLIIFCIFYYYYNVI
ncbi:cell division control protein 1 [Monosporozyma servazzii]